MVGRTGEAVDLGCGLLFKNRVIDQVNKRILPYYVGIWVLDGHGVFRDEQGQSHPVKAGDFIQLPSGKSHGVIHDSDGKWMEFFFHVPAPMYRSMTEMGIGYTWMPVLPLGLDDALMAQASAYLELLGGDEQDLSIALDATHGLMTAIHRQVTIAPQHEQMRGLILNACLLLAENLDSRVDVETLVKRWGMSLSYERFRKIFRQKVGMSPGEYRIRRRMDLARKLIAQDGLSNKDVAYSLGYADPFVFSRQFHRYVGMSPSQFRAMR